MHELGIVYEVVRSVEEIAQQNGLTKIDTIVLQIGELSSVIPKYIEDCFPAAIDGTFMQATKLRIEILPGRVRCQGCNQIYNPLQTSNRCPDCDRTDRQVISGQEFLIKEILAS